jgi:hypothetical protein
VEADFNWLRRYVRESSFPILPICCPILFELSPRSRYAIARSSVRPDAWAYVTFFGHEPHPIVSLSLHDPMPGNKPVGRACILKQGGTERNRSVPSDFRQVESFVVGCERGHRRRFHQMTRSRAAAVHRFGRHRRGKKISSHSRRDRVSRNYGKT